MMIKDNTNEISKIMQSLIVSYSEYFNKKYERTGHLFQNRYLSKPVESERYALVLQRYIHQNPPNMKYYKWSSYKEYSHKSKITDTEFVLELFSKDKKEAIKEFVKFNETIDKKMETKLYTELEITNSISDGKAIEIIKEFMNIDNVLEINKYNTEIRRKYIKDILEIKGITERQIARILQIDKSIVKRISREGCVPNGGNCPQKETSPKEVQNGEGNDSVCLQ